jgi:hypothetical protein
MVLRIKYIPCTRALAESQMHFVVAQYSGSNRVNGVKHEGLLVAAFASYRVGKQPV